VLARAAEPGGHENGADFVAIQTDRVGLVVQPGSAHVRGRGVIEQSGADLWRLAMWAGARGEACGRHPYD
jgi:hypothetical protein